MDKRYDVLPKAYVCLYSLLVLTVFVAIGATANAQKMPSAISFDMAYPEYKLSSVRACQ